MNKMLSKVEDEIEGGIYYGFFSRDIGKEILEKIWNIDLVAYIRLALIYRKFDSIRTFIKEMKKLKKEC
jgi:transcriptional repressor NrdR